ncbi:MAG TPA: phytanoyl-CoA dioxygenase family protein, partial [Planctomycetota bacterium]|nr:phytanoyl-CoA dioxygenase family protein [Planctomycetota bacterium]
MSALATASETLASTTLTLEEIEAWNRKGYHIHGKLFSDEEVAALREHCELVGQGVYETGIAPDGVGWKPGQDPLAVRKFDNCWKADRTVAAAVLSPRLGHVAAQLLGVDMIRMWHDQYLHKPANGGRTVTWHQDWAYWQALDRCETVTCWIALDDVRADSGPMVFLEGSHKYGLFPTPNRISGEDSAFPALPPE